MMGQQYMTRKRLFDKILNMNYQPHDRFNISSEVLSQEVNGETVLLDLGGE